MAALGNLVHPALFYEMCVTMIRMYRDGSYSVIFRNWRRNSASSTTTIEPAEPLDYLPSISPTSLVPPELLWEDTETPDLLISEETPLTDDTAMTDANREPGDTTMELSQSQENILAFQGDIYTINRRKKRAEKRLAEVMQARDKLEKAGLLSRRKGTPTYGQGSRRRLTPPVIERHRDRRTLTRRSSIPDDEALVALKKVRLRGARGSIPSVSSVDSAVSHSVESLHEVRKKTQKDPNRRVSIAVAKDIDRSRTSSSSISEESLAEEPPQVAPIQSSLKPMARRASGLPVLPLRKISIVTPENIEQQDSPKEEGPSSVTKMERFRSTDVSEDNIPLAETSVKRPASDESARPGRRATTFRTDDGSDAIRVQESSEQGSKPSSADTPPKPPPPDIIDMYVSTGVQHPIGLKTTSLKMDRSKATADRKMSTGDRRSPRVDEQLPSWFNLDYDGSDVANIDATVEAEILRQKVAAWDPSQEDAYALTAADEFEVDDDKKLYGPQPQAGAPGPLEETYAGQKKSYAFATESQPSRKELSPRGRSTPDADTTTYDDLQWAYGEEDIRQTQEHAPQGSSQELCAESKSSIETPTKAKRVQTTQPFKLHSSSRRPPKSAPAAEEAVEVAKLAEAPPRQRKKSISAASPRRGSLKEKTQTSSSEPQSSSFLLSSEVALMRTGASTKTRTKTISEEQRSRRSIRSVALVEYVPQDSGQLASPGQVKGDEYEEYLGNEWVASGSGRTPLTPTLTPTLTASALDLVDSGHDGARTSEEGTPLGTPKDGSPPATLRDHKEQEKQALQRPEQVTPQGLVKKTAETAAQAAGKDEGVQVSVHKRHKKKKKLEKQSREPLRDKEEAPELAAIPEKAEKVKKKRKKKRKHKKDAQDKNEKQTRDRQATEEHSERRVKSLEDINRFMEDIQAREDHEPLPTFSLSSLTSVNRSTAAAQPLRTAEFMRDYATLSQTGEVNLVINANTKNMTSMLWPFGLQCDERRMSSARKFHPCAQVSSSQGQTHGASR